MKLRTNILSLLAVTLLAATACDDDYIFEESAAERIEQGLERYEKALLDGKTWIMEYYQREPQIRRLDLRAPLRRGTSGPRLVRRLDLR